MILITPGTYEVAMAGISTCTLLKLRVRRFLSYVSAIVNPPCILHMQKYVKVMILAHALQRSVLASLWPFPLCLFALCLHFSLSILQHGRQQSFELDEKLWQEQRSKVLKWT